MIFIIKRCVRYAVKSGLFALIAVFIMFAAAGCNNNSANQKDNDSEPATPTGGVSGNNDEKEPVTNAKIQILRYDEELSEQYEAYREFIHLDEGTWLVITVDVPVYDFEYIKVGYTFTDDGAVFFADSVEYSSGELTPELPFKIKTFTNYGTMPQYGVSFTDTDHTKKYFYISESGKDGSLSFIEFENDTDSSSIGLSEETPPPSDSGAYPGKEDLKFGDLADMTFFFSSGAGAWFTEVKINPDGSFTGHFSDANMGESGNGYPNGTIYYCSFSGKFSALEKTGAYEYSMKCVSLTQEGNIGDETISDGVRYVISAPYGFDDADTFFLYLPGKSIDELPNEFLEWVAMPRAISFDDVDVLDFWGLYNAAGKQGFSW